MEEFFKRLRFVPFRELLSGCSMEHEFSSERHRSQVTSRTGGRLSLPAAVQHAQVFIQGSAFPGASLLAWMVKNLPAEGTMAALVALCSGLGKTKFSRFPRLLPASQIPGLVQCCGEVVHNINR